FSGSLSQTVKLFVEIENSGRNPFVDDFSLASMEWECNDGEEWQSVQVLSDETGGLLRSGSITLSLPCETALYKNENMEEAHYLRCRLLHNEYDIPPRVGLVVLGCADAVQVKTYSQALVLDYDGGGILPIDRYVGEDDLIKVFVKNGDEFIPCDDLCEVLIGEQPFLRKLRFDEEDFGYAPLAEDKILVVVSEEGISHELILGETDGTAGQQFEFAAENLFHLELGLFDKATDRLTIWNECSDLTHASCDDYVFYLDKENHMVCFGDGLHGREPDAGQTVSALTVQTSLLDGGNILRGQLTAVDFPEFQDLSVYNLENAMGGTRAENSDELEKQIEGKLRTATRAVTLQDIHDLVMETPGLLIDSVAVIPMKEYCRAYDLTYQPNTILVAVKPHTEQALPVLGEIYRHRIRAHLETARLLTTDIKIVPAQYVGISVFGRLSLTENNPQNQKLVAKEIERLVDTVSRGDFGRGTDYGRLFSAMEMLDCVRAVSQLSMEYIGVGGRKNEHGDIVVHPDSLSYLREIGIEFA
ncbi:MAG: hypothetical protein RR315_02160, partial [Oscillospiraceae bacterium]